MTAQTRRPLIARALMLAMVLGAGLFVGVVAALLSATFAGRSTSAFAVGPSTATCSAGAGGADTVTVFGTGNALFPDIIGVDANGDLELKASTGTGYAAVPGVSVGTWKKCDSNALTSLTITPHSGTTSEVLEIDESGTGSNTETATTIVSDEPLLLTSNNCINFNTTSAPTSALASTGGAGTLVIRDAPSGDVEFGATNLQEGTGCTTPFPAQLSAVQLIGNGLDKLSSAGFGTDTASTLPTTFTLSEPGSFTSENVVVGNGATTTFDFSNVGSSLSCTTSSTACSLYINSSGASQNDLPDGTTANPFGFQLPNGYALLYNGSTYEYWNFTNGNPATAAIVNGFEFTGLGPSPVSSFNNPVYLWGGSGTFTIPSMPFVFNIASVATAAAPKSSQIGFTGSSTLGSAASPMSGNYTAFYCGTGTDTLHVSGGHNTFFAGAGPDTFYDTGSNPNNTLDFSNVITSANASGQLVVNTSGSSVTVGSGQSTAQLSSGSAALGTTTQYTFLDGVGKSTDSNFTTFIAPKSGQTQFVAGDAAGLTFAGYASTSTDSIVYNTTNGIVANLSGVPQTGASPLTSGGSSVPWNNLASGQVLVDNPNPNIGVTYDTLSSVDSNDVPTSAISIFSVTGPAIGYSSFYSGTGTTAFSFTGGSGGNSAFYGSTAPVTFTAGGENNKIIAGAGIETFAETTTSQHPQNTIDFSNILTGDGVQAAGQTTRLVINVSGANLTVPNFGAGLITTPDGGSGGTTSATQVYSFGSGGSQFNQLIGASTGYTTFDGGSGQYSYTGQGAPNTNTLDFSAVPSQTASTLTLDTTPATPQATLGGVPESFSGVLDLIGLSSGGTTFVAGTTGGYIFQGNGTGNAAQFKTSAEINLTNQSSPIQDANGNLIGADQALIGNQVGQTCVGATVPSFCINLIDISSIAVGQPSSGQAFTIYAGPTTETFADRGTGDTVTLSFNYVSTGGNTGLSIDVSGGPNSGTATVGNVTYFFTSGTSAFKDLIGSASGLTSFIASPNPGYTYTANGSGNSIDFTSATQGVMVTYTGFTNHQATGIVCLNGGSCPLPSSPNADTITDITTVTGSTHGGNTFTAWGTGSSDANATTYTFTAVGNGNRFVGGAGGNETFNSTGTGNTFTAGQSNETFNGTQSGNTVDLSSLSTPATINVTGGSAIGSVNNNTASSGSFTYTFTSFGTNATVFYGSNNQTTFYAGATPDTFEGATGFANILSFQDATGTTLTLTVGSALACGHFGVAPSQSDTTLGSAQLGSVGESFCGITQLDGLPNGATSFVGAVGASPVGGYTFNGYGSNNSVSFAALSGTITADLIHNTVTFNGNPLAGSDTLVDITNVTGGSGSGLSDSGANANPGNRFIAGNQQNDTFKVPAGSTGNTIDFSNVQTSPSSQLVINLTGGPVNNQSNGTAAVSGFTYTFTGTAGAFTTFIGAGNGQTHFLAGAGPTTGTTYSFEPAGSTAGNLADFSAVPDALTAHLDTGTVSWTNTNTETAYIVGITTVIGSSSPTGGDHFWTGPSTYTITTSTGNGTFTLGSGSVTITDPNPGNTIDFSNVGGSGLTVNVSGIALGSLANNAATSGSSTYTFSNQPTKFKGDSTAPTYFYAGPIAGDSFTGTGGPVTLDYSQITPNGALTICAVSSPYRSCSAGQIFLGSVQQTFANVTNFKGLASGQTNFVGDNTASGLNFTGAGGTNTADFSTSSLGVTVDLQAETVGGTPTNDVTFGSNVSHDTITGVTVVYGSASHANTFIAGQTAESFADLGTGHQDTVDFSHVITSGASLLTVNVPSATAAGNGLTYTFSTGAADFTKFIGSSQGNTRFDAPKNTGGYTFTGGTLNGGSSANNTVDFSANSDDVVVNLSGHDVTDSVVGLLHNGNVDVDGTTNGATLDTIGNVQYVIGSPSAPNTFYGGLNGVQFQSASTFNTLSYFGLGSTPIYFNETTSTVYKLNPNGTPNSSVPSDTYNLPGTLVIEGTGGGDVFRVSSPTTQIEGGGGVDTLDLGALSGVTVDMQNGTVNGQGANNAPIGGITWSSACAPMTICDPNTLLTIGSILGSQGADTYQLAADALKSGAQALTITPGSKTGNTLDLSYVSEEPATVVMPVAVATKVTCTVGSTPTGCGSVKGNTSGATNVAFYGGITNLIGTANADKVFAGTGVENLTENVTSGGILDLSLLGPTNNTTYTGATVTVTDNAGIFQGTVTSPAQVGLSSANLTGFSTFIGTNGNDRFIQNGPAPTGGYMFAGGLGSNSVNLSSGDAGTTITLSAAPNATDGKTDGIIDTCLAGSVNNDGKVVDSGNKVVDQFSCVGNITSTGSTFLVEPGQGATVNGGGTGTLELIPTPPPMGSPIPPVLSNQGATVNLLTGLVNGPGGYNFTFLGMSAVDGTAANDTFIDGPGTYTLNGGGGSDAVSFAGAPSAVEVNLSNKPYQIPTGYSGSGGFIPAGTATGGYSGGLTLNGISSVLGTNNFNDLLVGASSGVGSMIGGSGNELFVLSGGFDYITAGSGNSILDLSLLKTDTTSLDLADAGPQYLGGASDGGVWLLAGNISEIIASPLGSTLLGGAGNMTLQGGTGADTLVAGSGSQTLIGGGGADTLIGGSGTDLLEGGAQAVTFQPGSGFDTLTSQTTGNTLSYVNAPNQVIVNLTSNAVSPPPPAPSPTGPNAANPSSALLTTFANTTASANTATGGWGATVSLNGAGISTVLGNSTSNMYVVDGNDTVKGGAGNDLYMVSGGNNTLTAGNGTRSVFMFLSGGSGNVINGGGYSTVDYSLGTAGVTVNLEVGNSSPGNPATQTGTATGGFVGSGAVNLAGILNAVGTNFNDHLIGGLAGGVIVGNGASSGCSANCGDFLQAGQNGFDTLEADTTGAASGDTTFCANAQCAVSGTSTNGGNLMIGGSGNDVFFANYGPGDVIYGGGGYNTAKIGSQDTPNAPAGSPYNINATLT